MSKPLPRWLTHRYAILWKEKKSNEFEYDEARELLKEKDDKTLSVILSQLRKYGWLETTLHPSDARKRTYRLKPPQDVLEEIARELEAK